MANSSKPPRVPFARRTYHGMSYTPEHVAWTAMWDRTTNPNNNSFPRYGGRGIRVCDEWRDFAVFYHDMGPKPTPDHSLDRYPDNDGNYEPGNVRWATDAEQTHNRHRWLTLGGKTATLHEWAATIGISVNGLRGRLASGWSEERILQKDAGRSDQHLLDFQGKQQTVAQWARECNIPDRILRTRLCKGWSVERALTTPVISPAGRRSSN
jgi:hypothetical protein